MNKLSICIYAAGVGAVYLSDLVVSTFFSNSTISSWAEIRSLIGISGILCLMGLDSVLIRYPNSSGRMSKLIILQIPVLALVVGYIIHSIGFLKSYEHAVLLAIAASSTIAIHQYFRTHHQKAKAQITQQAWRFFSLIGIILILLFNLHIEIDVLIIILMLICVGGTGYMAFVHKNKIDEFQNPEKFSSLYKLGIRFMVTSALLALAVYAEQLLVIKVGSTQDSAQYFTHATFFLFPISVINGYAGFLLGPWVRDNHDRFINVICTKWPLLLGSILAIAFLLNVIGHLGWQIMRPSIGDASFKLSLIFSLVGIVVTLYQLPSAYNGIFADIKHHDALILAQLAALVCGFFSFMVLDSKYGFPVIISVSLASLVNWTLRTASGIAVIVLIARKRNVKN